MNPMNERKFIVCTLLKTNHNGSIVHVQRLGKAAIVQYNCVRLHSIERTRLRQVRAPDRYLGH